MINLLHAKVEQESWESIAIDIARDGEKNDRGEFEQAVQALKNITADRTAASAAKEISEKWTTSDIEDIRNDADLKKLKALKRYPTMNDLDVLKQTVALLEKPSIDTFLKNEKINADLTEAKAEIKRRETA